MYVLTLHTQGPLTLTRILILSVHERTQRRCCFYNTNEVLVSIYLWPADESEATPLGMLSHDNIINAGSAMDDRQRSGVISYDDADMLAVGVKRQVTGLRVVPCYSIAIAILAFGAAAVAR